MSKGGIAKALARPDPTRPDRRRQSTDADGRQMQTVDRRRWSTDADDRQTQTEKTTIEHEVTCEMLGLCPAEFGVDFDNLKGPTRPDRLDPKPSLHPCVSILAQLVRCFVCVPFVLLTTNGSHEEGSNKGK